MRIGSLGFGSAVLFSLLSAGSASAQRVSADIRIGGRGPISGHVRIDSRERDRYRDRYYRENRYRPRQIRVEVFRRDRDRGRHLGWYRQLQRRGRVVVVYYDRDEDCYYDRRFYPGLQEVRVYEDDGRYYRPDDDRDFDGRYDDRWDRRDGGRYDPRDERDRRGGRGDWDNQDGRDGRNH